MDRIKDSQSLRNILSLDDPDDVSLALKDGLTRIIDELAPLRRQQFKKKQFEEFIGPDTKRIRLEANQALSKAINQKSQDWF